MEYVRRNASTEGFGGRYSESKRIKRKASWTRATGASGAAGERFLKLSRRLGNRPRTINNLLILIDTIGRRCEKDVGFGPSKEKERKRTRLDDRCSKFVQLIRWVSC